MIHPTAIVSAEAQIDPTAEIGPWCYIQGPVRIGPRTRLLNGVTVLGDVTIGADNHIATQAVIGGRPQDPTFKDEPGAVVIGDRNSIHEFVTIAPGTPRARRVTQVGDDTMIMAYVHLGHDVSVGNRCRLVSYAVLAGHAELHDDVVVYGQCGLVQFVRVGAYSFLTARTGLELDVPPFMIADGRNGASQLHGANLVGLKRHNFSRSDIQQIRDIVSIWTDKSRTAADAQHYIDECHGESPLGGQFVQFLKSTVRGVMR